MGEIADALRRSGIRGAGGSEPNVLRADDFPPMPAGAPLEPPVAGRGSRPPQALRPTDPAILTEGRPELEACRQVALRLRSELERCQARSVAVVSALRGEGKTTTSWNLAISLSSLGTDRGVAVVGLDLRRPRLAQVLGIEASVGIEEVLAGRASLEDARVPIENPALDVFPAKVPQRAAHEILTSRHLKDFITALERRYDTVIVDTPPVLLVPDTRMILEHVPVCVPVARVGWTRVRSFREMLGAIPQRQVLSTLLNGSRRSSHYYNYGSDLEGDEGAKERKPSRLGRQDDKSG